MPCDDPDRLVLVLVKHPFCNVAARLNLKHHHPKPAGTPTGSLETAGNFPVEIATARRALYQLSASIQDNGMKRNQKSELRMPATMEIFTVQHLRIDDLSAPTRHIRKLPQMEHN